MLRSTLAGSYPRVSDAPLPVSLREMLHKHSRREISDAELERAYEATITRIVKEQESAGIDLLTDGQIRWDDLLTLITLRHVDNNVY